jgi:hypothetical protein
LAQEVIIKAASMEILSVPRADVPKPQNVKAILLARAASFNWAVNQLSLDDNGIEIAKALRNGSAIAVSDGLYKDGRGTAAFITEGESPKGHLFRVNIVPGEEDCPTAYRSELSGVAGIVESLKLTVSLLPALSKLATTAIKLDEMRRSVTGHSILVGQSTT